MANTQNNSPNKARIIIKIVGVILLLCGLTLIVWGTVDFIKALQRRDFPSLFWLIMLGFIFLGIGGGFTMSGFRKEIQNAIAKHQAAVLNETIKNFPLETTPPLNVPLKEETGNVCTCGTRNDKNAKFCDQCGKKLI